MSKIHEIPQYLVSKIAAGEVIERPVYAVKELVENAIDAGASSVSVTIEDAGLKKIVVSDNGEGMSEEDILLSFKPHTTSKLHEDLIGISTLGFRGEALASIAAVSNLILQSRIHNSPAGFQVIIHNGVLENSGPIGIPPGTTVTVQNLFHSVPARKKFLKSERTEFRHIVELVTQYALSYPEIRLLLIHNDRVIFDLPGNQQLKSRLEKLLGPTLSQDLLPVRPDDLYIGITGMIAHPQRSTYAQNKQYLFINNRIVSDRKIAAAVKESFGSLLEQTRYPVFILFLKVPYEIVDVNVHPRKEYITFLNTDVILEEIKKAVTQTLQNNNVIFRSSGIFSSRAGTTSSYAADVLRESVIPWTIKDSAISRTSEIQQLHNLYLLVQTSNGFMMIDQHAAHERILYEQFFAEFQKKSQKQKSVKLKKPAIIDLPFVESENIKEYLKEFNYLGFEIESFKDNSYRIDAVPELFQDRDVRELVVELLEQFSENKKSVDHFSNLMISFLACRAAIKAGDILTKDEAKKLVQKLQKTKNNSTCPHGRPTMVSVSIEEINRMFKR